MLITQSCLTLCDPMDCSLPGSFVNGIFQARILEWVATSSSSYCWENSLYKWEIVYSLFEDLVKLLSTCWIRGLLCEKSLASGSFYLINLFWFLSFLNLLFVMYLQNHSFFLKFSNCGIKNIVLYHSVLLIFKILIVTVIIFPYSCLTVCIAVVQSCLVQLFATPRTAACQRSLSSTVSWSLLKLVSIESVMPSNHLILCRPFLLFVLYLLFTSFYLFFIQTCHIFVYLN